MENFSLDELQSKGRGGGRGGGKKNGRQIYFGPLRGPRGRKLKGRGKEKPSLTIHEKKLNSLIDFPCSSRC